MIDWPNAARGPAASDVAHTWLVLACSTPTTGTYRRALSVVGGKAFASLFLRRFDRPRTLAHVSAAGTYRLATRALPRSEVAAIERRVARTG